MRRTLAAGVALVAVLAHGAAAGARSVHDEPYTFETTWNAAVRMVRVDLGCPILERDQDVGYFTFTYRDGPRTVPGSIEIVRTEVDGRTGARVIVQIPEMPTYVESMMLTRLGRKLRTEFGEPPPPVRHPPVQPPGIPDDRAPDGGTPAPGESPGSPSPTPPADRPSQNSSHAASDHARESC